MEERRERAEERAQPVERLLGDEAGGFVEVLRLGVGVAAERAEPLDEVERGVAVALADGAAEERAEEVDVAGERGRDAGPFGLDLEAAGERGGEWTRNRER